MNKTLKTIIVLISLFIIATIPIIFAAVQPWVWSIYCLMMVAAIILSFWTIPDRSGFPRVRTVNFLVAVFFLWTLILYIPFPYQVISFLSPTRADILSRAWALNGSTPEWESLSYLSWPAFAWWGYLLSLGFFFFVLRNLCTERNRGN